MGITRSGHPNRLKSSIKPHTRRQRPPLRFAHDRDAHPPHQGRHPAPRGRARRTLARTPRHDPRDRGSRVRLGLGRRTPPLPLRGRRCPRAMGSLGDARCDRGCRPPVSSSGRSSPARPSTIQPCSQNRPRPSTRCSGGRFVLGLGAGWNEPEFRAYGFPFDHRIARFEEAFTIIRTLLREGAIDFDGRWYQARDCELLPRGPRPAGPPLMIGSIGPRMLRATMAHADAWNAWFVDIENRPTGVPAVRALVDAACREVGRDPDDIERTVAVLVRMPGGSGRPARSTRNMRCSSRCGATQPNSPTRFGPTPAKASPTSSSSSIRSRPPRSGRLVRSSRNSNATAETPGRGPSDPC